MDELKNSISQLVSDYLEVQPKPLSVDLAIELFKDVRNYPSYYSDDAIYSDIEKNVSKIAMAVIEIDAKDGVEGQTSMQESGINRVYGTNPIPKAYASVIPLAHLR